MATLRNKKKLAAISRETAENTRNSLSQNTLDPGMAQEYISQVSEEIEERVTKRLSKEFSRTESRILRALSKLDEFVLNPQVRTCSLAVPGTSRNNDSENREPTGYRCLGDPCPEAVFSTYHFGNLNDSELEETHHSSNFLEKFPSIFFQLSATSWIKSFLNPIVKKKLNEIFSGINWPVWLCFSENDQDREQNFFKFLLPSWWFCILY